MKQTLSIWLSASLLALLACGENDLGSGVNTVDREFSKTAPEVWAAAVKSTEKADLKISSDAHDKLGGELVACRAGGTEVRIWVKGLDERSSRVSVRVEPGDRALAIMIQERIAENLGLGEARAALFGGNSLEGTYATPPDLCLSSARRVFSTLKVTPTDEETHAAWSRIDGRLRDSTPVRIRFDKVDSSQTRVNFTAGNEKTEDNKAFVHRMKDEFELMTRTSRVED
ncbi:MAG: hypothetical protein HY293_14140 [Planctomycetes bacterium]|nr:hypothetical protein [Planctomycetota bacterium]